MEYLEFSTWSAVLDAAERGEVLYYKGPLDYQPVRVTVLLRGRQVRVTPPTHSDADPFMADEKHLDRFRRATQ